MFVFFLILYFSGPSPVLLAPLLRSAPGSVCNGGHPSRLPPELQFCVFIHTAMALPHPPLIHWLTGCGSRCLSQ